MPTRRRSEKRDAIYAAIAGTREHPSAEWVYSRLKADYPDLSLGTVYRNIGEFKREGRLIAVANVDGQERLDANTAPHTHFICERCGAVVDLAELEADPAPIREAASRRHLTLRYHQLMLYGLCPRCRGNEPVA